MGSLKVNYNGATINTITANKNITLTTAGKYSTGNIQFICSDICRLILNRQLGGTSYNSNTYTNTSATYTLPTNGKYINGNIVANIITTHNFNTYGSWVNYDNTNHTRSVRCGICSKYTTNAYAAHTKSNTAWGAWTNGAWTNGTWTTNWNNTYSDGTVTQNWSNSYVDGTVTSNWHNSYTDGTVTANWHNSYVDGTVTSNWNNSVAYGEWTAWADYNATHHEHHRNQTYTNMYNHYWTRTYTNMYNHYWTRTYNNMYNHYWTRTYTNMYNHYWTRTYTNKYNHYRTNTRTNSHNRTWSCSDCNYSYLETATAQNSMVEWNNGFSNKAATTEWNNGYSNHAATTQWNNGYANHAATTQWNNGYANHANTTQWNNGFSNKAADTGYAYETHNWNAWSAYIYSSINATNHYKIRYHECTVCEHLADETTTPAHTWNNGTAYESINVTNHHKRIYNKCTLCEYNSWTNTTPAHSWSNTVVNYTNISNTQHNTLTNNHCTLCTYYTLVNTPTAHSSYGSWTNYGNGTYHRRACGVCGGYNYATHTWSNTTTYHSINAANHNRLYTNACTTSSCGYISYTNTTQAHTWNNGVIYTNINATNHAKNIYNKCTLCTYNAWSNSTPGHDWSNTVVNYTNISQTQHNTLTNNHCTASGCGYYTLVNTPTAHSSYGGWTNYGDGTYHRRACGVCGGYNYGAHTWSNTTTYHSLNATNHNRLYTNSCTTSGCGYVSKTNTTQAHTWNNGVIYTNINATNHAKNIYNKCTLCTYNAWSNSTPAHDWANVIVSNTNISQTQHNVLSNNKCSASGCGYFTLINTTVAHSSYSDWANYGDGTYHRRKCGVCGGFNYGAHTWSNTTDYISINAANHNRKYTNACTTATCGYVSITNTTQVHTWNNGVQYQNINATNHYKRIYNKCTLCTYNSWTNTTPGHDWSNTVVNYTNISNTQHNTLTNNKCSASGCGYYILVNTTVAHSSYTAWSSVNATTHRRACGVCGGYNYGTHTWNNGVQYASINATNHYKNIYNKCTDCSYNVWSNTTPAHDWSNTVVNYTNISNTQHNTLTNNKCTASGCGYYTLVNTSVAHSSYTAWASVNATTHRRSCGVCGGYNYGTHSWNNGIQYKNINATNHYKNVYNKCNDCSYNAWSNTTPGHDWSNTVVNHTNISQTQHNTLTNNKCTASGCGYYILVNTPTAHSSYSGWTNSDNTYHKRSCGVCGGYNYGAHTKSESWTNGTWTNGTWGSWYNIDNSQHRRDRTNTRTNTFTATCTTTGCNYSYTTTATNSMIEYDLADHSKTGTWTNGTWSNGTWGGWGNYNATHHVRSRTNTRTNTITYTCSSCNYSYSTTQQNSMVEYGYGTHTWNTWSAYVYNSTNATHHYKVRYHECTTTGCGYLESEGSQQTHTWNNGTAYESINATNHWKRIYNKCTLCTYNSWTNTTPAHSWNNAVAYIYVNATHHNYQVNSRCSQCTYYKITNTAQTHHWSAYPGSWTYYNTKNHQRYIDYTCDDCGGTKSSSEYGAHGSTVDHYDYTEYNTTHHNKIQVLKCYDCGWERNGTTTKETHTFAGGYCTKCGYPDPTPPC